MFPVAPRSKFFLIFLLLVSACLYAAAGGVATAAATVEPDAPDDSIRGAPAPMPLSGTVSTRFMQYDFSPDPRLTEAGAKDIASRLPGIAAVLEKHQELERHAAYDSGRGIWTVFWTLPGNYHRLAWVDILDSSGAVLFSRIETETYFDVIPSLSEPEAIDLAREQQRVRQEVEGKEVDSQASYGSDRIWTVGFYEGQTEVAQVLIDDSTGLVNEVRTGPQVAWQMARGYKGAFGRIVNEPYVWLPLSALFLLPFIDIRRPFRIVHLDLLVLLSFSVSHYFFNQGQIFKSVPLVYPPLAYLFLRLGWIGMRRGRGRSQALMFPSSFQEEGWGGGHPPLGPLSSREGKLPAGVRGASAGTQPELADVAMPHLNFRPRLILIGLVALIIIRLVINIADSNVVDVGYSGVIGAQRIVEGEAPYGHMPSDNANGDTYGPLNYLLYVPFEKVFPWSGEWDGLPAAHAAAIFFDLLAVAGMFMAGRCLMRGRPAERNRLGLALAYGWVAYPYTTFVLNCNVNDTIMAAFLVWGFVFLKKAPLAGVLLGFATQIKFAPAILGPLWASFPRAWHGWGRRALFLLGFAAGLAIALPVIFLGDGSLGTFWERTIAWQAGRDSPFSIWGQYPGRLAGAQRVGEYVMVAVALGAYLWPPRKTMVQVAAVSAALILGFQMLQTHWFYLYIPWFFPLALIAILARGGGSVKGIGPLSP